MRKRAHLMHTDQLDVTTAIVRRLIDDQFPELRDLAIEEVASDGTVNAIYRVGNNLAARFPLRDQDPSASRLWLESEARASRELASCSPAPTPMPVAIGAPGHGYPLPWAVQTWLPGNVATVEDPAHSIPFAEDLASFITSLRAADTQGRRFSGRGRGGSLTDHDKWIETCFLQSAELVDVIPFRRLWEQLRTLPSAGPDVMTHGDLVPGNVLVSDGRLVGVLDPGGFGPADRALDLVGAWHLLDSHPREEFRRALSCGDIEWARGIAWALEQAMGLVWYYVVSNPSISRIGRRTLERIVAET